MADTGWNTTDAGREWRREWQREYRQRRKDIRLKSLYGITLEDYNKMFQEQNGCCKICNKHQTEEGVILCVDHDHTTGKVRGLLCKKCNQAIGLLKDSIENCLSAAEYLKEYK